VAFALVLLLLVGSIPALAVFGSQLIADSQDGSFAGRQLLPSDPGFEAQVEPTSTAVAIHFDGDNLPTAVTFLALSGADGGGSVIFVPLDSEVSEPVYGIGDLRTAYQTVAGDPELAKERLASQVSRLLNVGIDEIIELSNPGWEQLVAPVVPLRIDNPDAMDIGYGITFPSGPIEIPADLVGAYLSTTLPNESDLNRLNRHAVVWEAWLEQVAASGRDDAVPGETTAGIGRFARALSAGPVLYETLPVNDFDPVARVWDVDVPGVNRLVTEAVASPTAAVPGSRFTVRLLNGVSADAVPGEIVRQVVGRGGAVTILGNGPEFGTDETTIVYANPKQADVAKLLATSLGATGKVRLDREAPDTVDLTIVLGRDVLGSSSGGGTPGATTPDPPEGN